MVVIKKFISPYSTPILPYSTLFYPYSTPIPLRLAQNFSNHFINKLFTLRAARRGHMSARGSALKKNIPHQKITKSTKIAITGSHSKGADRRSPDRAIDRTIRILHFSSYT